MSSLAHHASLANALGNVCEALLLLLTCSQYRFQLLFTLIHAHPPLLLARKAQNPQNTHGLRKKLGLIQACTHTFPERGPHVEARPRQEPCSSFCALREVPDTTASWGIHDVLLASKHCILCPESKSAHAILGYRVSGIVLEMANPVCLPLPAPPHPLTVLTISLSSRPSSYIFGAASILNTQPIQVYTWTINAFTLHAASAAPLHRCALDAGHLSN